MRRGRLLSEKTLDAQLGDCTRATQTPRRIRRQTQYDPGGTYGGFAEAARGDTTVRNALHARIVLRYKIPETPLDEDTPVTVR